MLNTSLSLLSNNKKVPFGLSRELFRKRYFAQAKQVIDSVESYITAQIEQDLAPMAQVLSKQAPDILEDNPPLDSCLVILSKAGDGLRIVKTVLSGELGESQMPRIESELQFLFAESSQSLYDLSDMQHSELSLMGMGALLKFDLDTSGLPGNARFQLWFGYDSKIYPGVQQYLKARDYAIKFLQTYFQKKKLSRLKEKVLSSRRNNIEKNQFISGLSHDLRSPINNLNAVIKCLSDTSLDSENNDLFKLADNNLTMLKDMVEDLLNLARYRSGTLQANFVQVNAKQELQSVAEVFSYDIKLKELAIKLVLPSEPLFIEADPLQIKRICSNLLSNAIKYTDCGGIEIQLTKLDDVYAQISVFDTGQGLTPEQIKRICRPFERFNDQEVDGVGLGMAVTKLLIKLHQGQLEIYSSPGEGTEFRVILPISQKEAMMKVA